MTPQQLPRFLLRLLLAWLGVSALLLLLEGWIAAPLASYLTWLFHQVPVDYALELSARGSEPPGITLTITATARRVLTLAPESFLLPGTSFQTTATLLHLLVPASIILSLVLAWPLRSFGQRLVLLGLGLLVAVVHLTLLEPLVILGSVEMAPLVQVQNSGQQVEEPLIVGVMLFLESGGRWLTAVLAAVVAVSLYEWLFNRVRPGDSPDISSEAPSAVPSAARPEPMSTTSPASPGQRSPARVGPRRKR